MRVAIQNRLDEEGIWTEMVRNAYVCGRRR
jgi:hypothetical protein